MNKRPSKSQIRASLDNQVNDFLKQGGTIQEYHQGDSSLVDGRYDRNQFVYGLPKQERTPIPASAISLEKKAKSTVAPAPSRRLRRVKKMLYDDFGEPIREVWVEQ